MKIPLSKIVIGERQRAYNEPHAQQLALSMQDIGQIHNIGCRLLHFNDPLDPFSYLLVWGRHRYEAAKILKWVEIDCIVRDDLSPALEQELEYEEDARRLDRSWQEKCTAVAKLKRLKEKRTGETWSMRKMADFTGLGKSSIGYMMQVAEALNTTPKDEEMWVCDNYLSAIKLLMVRVHKTVNDELQRQRQAADASVLGGEQTAPSTGEGDLPFPPVQQLDTTPEETVIFVHWRKKSFSAAVPDVDLISGRAQCILGYKCEEKTYGNVIAALDPNRFAIMWGQEWGFDDTEIMPWTLIWNTLSQEVSDYPFTRSYVHGQVVFKNKPALQSCRASVITAAQDNPDHLPSTVVEYCIDAVCPPNMPVFCIGGVRPVHVAMTGHTPIFFEPDEVLAAKYIKELKEFYEETVPGAKVEVRS